MTALRSTKSTAPSESLNDQAIFAAAEDILRIRLLRLGVIQNPTDAFEFLRMRLGGLCHEEFHALWLDTDTHDQ